MPAKKVKRDFISVSFWQEASIVLSDDMSKLRGSVFCPKFLPTLICISLVISRVSVVLTAGLILMARSCGQWSHTKVTYTECRWS
jgi:hypothetical protein